MKPLIWLPLSCVAALLFSSCANNRSTADSDPIGTGPFDAQGNYREDWADDPTKWRRPGRQTPSNELPAFAAADLPPAHASPLPPARSSASRTATRPTTATRTTTATRPVAATTAKPKPVAAKPKPKPQPAAITYTVKKGDTLSAIASRHGSTVAKIRSANGISGSMIHPGQKLKVPKR
jgi:LysM repeat protein